MFGVYIVKPLLAAALVALVLALWVQPLVCAIAGVAVLYAILLVKG